MDLKTLQTEHSELYSAVLNQGKTEGHKAGVAEGTEAERKRVADHLEAGEACGDMKLANQAITEGKSFSDMQAKYFSASMKRNAVANRQADSDDAGAALDGNKPPVAKDAEDEVAAELEKLMGPADTKGKK